jgi:hypothetical protein
LTCIKQRVLDIVAARPQLLGMKPIARILLALALLSGPAPGHALDLRGARIESLRGDLQAVRARSLQAPRASVYDLKQLQRRLAGSAIFSALLITHIVHSDVETGMRQLQSYGFSYPSAGTCHQDPSFLRIGNLCACHKDKFRYSVGYTSYSMALRNMFKRHSASFSPATITP